MMEPPDGPGRGRYYPRDATCVVGSCESRPRRRWMCQKHWGRWLRHGDPGTAKRPWADTVKTPYCVRGHDKREVGTTSQGACHECNRMFARRAHARRRRRENPVPNLRTVRRGFGLSQQAFADLADLHINCVWALENVPGRKARPSTQEKIVEAVATLQGQRRRRRETRTLRVAKELIAA